MALMDNPSCSATYDEQEDAVLILFRDGRDISVARYNPEHIPKIINCLMDARRRSKEAKAPVPLPPPMRRPPIPVRSRRDPR